MRSSLPRCAILAPLLLVAACSDPVDDVPATRGEPLAADVVRDDVVAEPAADADTRTSSTDRRPAPAAGCVFGGKRYRTGDRFHDALRCNSCGCGADGSVSCTERFCDPAEACALGDQKFAAGTSIVCDDGCNRCQCADRGWTSTLALCGPLPRVERCDDTPKGVVTPSVLYRKGDALALELGMGGCQGETPPVKLCWDGAIAESLPVQMWLRVVPTTITSCSGWVTQQKVFDLTPLKEAFRAGYPGQTGRVWVHVGTETVDYTF